MFIYILELFQFENFDHPKNYRIHRPKGTGDEKLYRETAKFAHSDGIMLEPYHAVKVFTTAKKAVYDYYLKDTLIVHGGGCAAVCNKTEELYYRKKRVVQEANAVK
jgi:hypothetical protein